MPRYVQKWNEEQGKHVLVEVGATVRREVTNIQGPGEDFVSPIDGTIVRGRKGLREHCEKHGVVPAQEFSPEYYAKKAEERAKIYTGKYDREETWRRRAQINDIITQIERR